MPVKTTCKCGKSFNAPDALIGKTVKCPACQSPIDIMREGAKKKVATDRINVICPHCQTGIKAPSKYAGKQIGCPKCKQPVNIPLKKKEIEVPKNEFGLMEDIEKVAATKICSGCNAKVKADDKLCIVCGTILSSGINIGRTQRGMEGLSIKEKIGQGAVVGAVLITASCLGYWIWDSQFRTEIEAEEFIDSPSKEEDKPTGPVKKDKKKPAAKDPDNGLKDFANEKDAGTVILNTSKKLDAFTKRTTYTINVSTTLLSGYLIGFSKKDPVRILTILDRNGKSIPVVGGLFTDPEGPVSDTTLIGGTPAYNHFNKTFQHKISFSAKEKISGFNSMSGAYAAVLGHGPKKTFISGSMSFDQGETATALGFVITAASGKRLSCSVNSAASKTRMTFYDLDGKAIKAKLISVTGGADKANFTYVFPSEFSYFGVAAIVYDKVKAKNVAWNIVDVSFK